MQRKNRQQQYSYTLLYCIYVLETKGLSTPTSLSCPEEEAIPCSMTKSTMESENISVIYDYYYHKKHVRKEVNCEKRK